MIPAKPSLLLVCLIFFIATISAQSYVTRIYTTSDGLPDAFVNSIYQDSKGYLWLGTRTSLCRFNGHQFVNYGATIGNDRFAGSVLLEDRQHRLWVHTKSGVAVLKNKSLNYFPTSDGLKIDWLFSFTEFSDGKLWMLSDKGIYELQDTLWKKLNLVPEYKDLPCRHAVEGPNGIYLSYGWQLYLYKKNGAARPITPRQTRYPYYVWLKKYHGQVYVNTVEGIYKIVDDSLKRIFEKQIHGIYSYDFLVDSKKRMWISTETDGLWVSEPGNETELSHQIKLPFNQTLLFTEDVEGNIWASNYEGLVKIRSGYAEVFNQQQNPLLEDIRHLAVQPGGEILIKSATHGFISFSKNEFFIDKKFALANQALQKAVIDVSANDSSGNLWVVTRSGDLYKINSAGLNHVNETVKGEFFRSVAYDAPTNTIFACGVKLYTAQNGSIKEFTSGSSIAQPRRIFCNGGKIIVSTNDSGVYIISPQNTGSYQVRKWVDNNFEEDFQLFTDPDGGFWTTSPTGLQKWYWSNDSRPAQQLALSTTEGLPNPYVVAACFDQQHRMWVATLSGLVVIEKNQSGSYTVNQIDEETPFHFNNWGEAQLITDKHGSVWLSSFHELVRFHTEQLYFDKAVPRVAINEVLLNLRKTDWTKKTESLDDLHQIPLFVKLGHNENTISISFDAITFSHNDHALFSYKLEGLDTAWQTPTNIRSVSFANLAPGSYHFFVRVRKPNTGWSEPSQFSFVIRPPFWVTWWFQLFLIVAAATVIALFFRSRIQRIKTRAKLQQQIQELDLKALKAANALMAAKQKMTLAEMQALRAQMNPHFIYNSLNSIQALVLDKKWQEAIRYIGKFARLLRQVLEQSDDNLITLEKELSTLQLYIQLEELRMDASLEVTIDVDDQLMPEKELIPPLIIQPYVENALWHGLSRKKDERKLWIDVSANEEWLFIKIRDNGIGRQQAAVHKKENGLTEASKGMSITANRLALLNGPGTETAVSVLDLYDEQQQPSGTEVTLQIIRTTKV